MNDLKNFLLSAKEISWPNFTKLIKWSYLTDPAVSIASPYMSALGYLFIALILIGIIFSVILAKKQKPLPIYNTLRSHVLNLSLWMGIIGLLLVISRYQAIRLLSTRILMLLVLLIILVWGFWIINYIIFVIPKIRQEYINKKNFQKYLPAKKKRLIR